MGLRIFVNTTPVISHWGLGTMARGCHYSDQPSRYVSPKPGLEPELMVWQVSMLRTWPPRDINRQILCMAFNHHTGTLPMYLQDLLIPASTAWPRVCSERDTSRLAVPFTESKTFADRSFSCYGHRLWNTLPESLRSHTDIKEFEKRLKDLSIWPILQLKL